MTAWHIHNKTLAHPLRGFKKTLHTLVPVLRQVTKHCQVVWLNQFPLAESLVKSFCTKCNQEVVERYNVAAKHILGSVDSKLMKVEFVKHFRSNRKTKAVVWDADSQLATQYIRSCALNNRDDILFYWNCPDYIHTGYVALDRRSHLLFDLMCTNANKLIVQ
jgi:hypothetical protein